MSQILLNRRMNNFKCEKCGQCCGPVPFTMPMFNRFKDKAVRGYTMIPFDGVHVVPLTNDGNCVFLSVDNSCVIYPNRPKVCRLQGRIPELPCPHSEGYEDSPYPERYDQMIKVLLDG